MKSDLLWQHISNICAPIPPRLGVRRSRAIGAKLFKALRAKLGSADAQALAESISGAPVGGLTARETIHALRAHGVRTRDIKLPYRLKERFRLTEGTWPFLLNRNGQCAPAATSELRRPVVRLTIIIHISDIRCVVEPLSEQDAADPIARHKTTTPIACS